MTIPIERARAALAAQPFSVPLGTEVGAIDDDVITLELPLRDEFRQQFGFAHGGLVGYLADNALAFAGAAALGEAIVTVEMKINYLRPAIGERLIARASAISGGRSLAITRCEVFAVRDGRETLCAAAQGTIARLPPKEPAA